MPALLASGGKIVPVDDVTATSVFPGNTEMARDMRHFDWANTPLGPAEQCPMALKTVVRILLTSRQPVWVGWGRELTFLYNNSCLPMLGDKHSSALGQPVAAVWREIWDEIRPLLDAALEGGAVACDEENLLIRRRDSHSVETYHTFSCSPIAGDDGTIGGILCVNTVDTERMAGERRLADFNTGTFRWDPATGEYLEFDENLKALFGLDRRLPVRSLNDVVDRIHPDDVANVLAAIERRRGGVEFELEFRVLLADGGVRWLYNRAGLQFDAGGRSTYVAGACTDITRQKLAEEASARLAAIVEWSDDAIVSKDLNGIITSWNGGAERIFGYRAEEVIGRSVTLLIPEDHLDEEPRILERIRRGEAVDHYETIRRRKDGRLIDISLTVSPILDAQGRVIGASKIARDVTHRKRLEAELREADRRKDDFLATLAHELRNPLAPLRMGLDLLRATGGGGDEVQGMMERQIGHMVRLVDELMEVSRITCGKIELRKERLDLAAVIQGAIETSRPLIDAAGHTLEVQFHDGPLNVHGDALRLSQILTNLLNNAAKYTPKGGRIWLTAQREGVEAVIRICDNGLGIPPEMLPKVFQMFTQIDRDLQRSQGGLGIGLSLVKSLVQMHGGGIEATSEGAGKGSQFTLRLPRADEAGFDAHLVKPVAFSDL